MADMEGTLMNGVNGEGTATDGQSKKEGFLSKSVNAIKTGYIRVRSTKGGRVIIGGTKLALMGLGLWKAGELVHETKKKDDPVVVVIKPVETVQESAPAEEEPAAEETANETVTENE